MKKIISILILFVLSTNVFGQFTPTTNVKFGNTDLWQIFGAVRSNSASGGGGGGAASTVTVATILAGTITSMPEIIVGHATGDTLNGYLRVNNAQSLSTKKSSDTTNQYLRNYLFYGGVGIAQWGSSIDNRTALSKKTLDTANQYTRAFKKTLDTANQYSRVLNGQIIYLFPTKVSNDTIAARAKRIATANEAGKKGTDTINQNLRKINLNLITIAANTTPSGATTSSVTVVNTVTVISTGIANENLQLTSFTDTERATCYAAYDTWRSTNTTKKVLRTAYVWDGTNWNIFIEYIN